MSQSCRKSLTKTNCLYICVFSIIRLNSTSTEVNFLWSDIAGDQVRISNDDGNIERRDIQRRTGFDCKFLSSEGLRCQGGIGGQTLKQWSITFPAAANDTKGSFEGPGI